MAVERSLILIKPDAVERKLAGEILARIERRGFTLRAGKLVHVDRELDAGQPRPRLRLAGVCGARGRALVLG